MNGPSGESFDKKEIEGEGTGKTRIIPWGGMMRGRHVRG